MDIHYEIIDVKNIEIIRPLFDELMLYQKSKAKYGKWIFNLMTMELRVHNDLKKEAFKETYLILVKDHDEPVGFAYSCIDKEDFGNLKLFYLKPAYRGKGIGNTLFDMSMKWIKQFDTHQIVIYVSNGNFEAMKFYENRGFEFISTKVFGMISRFEEQR